MISQIYDHWCCLSFRGTHRTHRCGSWCDKEISISPLSTDYPYLCVYIYIYKILSQCVLLHLAELSPCWAIAYRILLDTTGHDEHIWTYMYICIWYIEAYWRSHMIHLDKLEQPQYDVAGMMVSSSCPKMMEHFRLMTYYELLWVPTRRKFRSQTSDSRANATRSRQREIERFRASTTSQSISALCHQWITKTYLSYSFLFETFCHRVKRSFWNLSRIYVLYTCIYIYIVLYTMYVYIYT